MVKVKAKAKARPSKGTPVVLTEKRAYDLAVAASWPLLDRVRLVADTRDGTDVVGRTEWIEIAVPLPEKKPYKSLQATLEWVAQARDACLVWHMLSCCRGFQGHENDVFWKKLIDRLAKKDEEFEEEFDEDLDDDEEDREWWGPTTAVGDAHTFFPSSDATTTTFPRLRLHVPFSLYFDDDGLDLEDGDLKITRGNVWVSHVVRTFIGLSNTRNSDIVQKSTAQLVDYIDFERYCHAPVEIGVHVGKSYDLDDVADMLTSLVADIERDTWARKQEPIPQRVLGQSRFPLTKFTEFCLRDLELINDEYFLNEFTEILRSSDISIPRVNIQPDSSSGMDMGEDALGDFMEAIARDRGEGTGSVDTLGLYVGKAEPRQVACLFSAIPITGVRMLCVRGKIRGYREQGVTMDPTAWTWLAYAVYHPWLADASLYLDLQYVDVSEATARPMRSALAAQRHLYRMLHGEDDETLPTERDELDDTLVGRYAIVTVYEGARCFEDASLDSEDGVVQRFSCDTDLTAVIKFTTLTVEALPDAVCVIVPGMGVRWISKDDVVHVARPEASFSLIRGVRFGRNYTNPTLETAVLQPLMRLVDSLDLSAWGMLSSDKLLDVLRVCSMLTSLRVEHTGDLWCGWKDDTLSHDLALTSLHMTYCADRVGSFRCPSPAAWTSIFRNLSDLSLQTLGERMHHRYAVRAIFRQARPVQRFLWRAGDYVSVRRSYAAKCDEARDSLGVWTGRLDTAQRAFSVRAKCAFASVIAHKNAENNARNDRHMRETRSRTGAKGSALGALSPELAQLICAFATTDTVRVVWVDDW